MKDLMEVASSMITAESIQCAVCHRRVSSVMCMENWTTNEFDFIAQCHGDRQTFSVPMAVFAQGERIELREAFLDKYLERGAAHRNDRALETSTQSIDSSDK